MAHRVIRTRRSRWRAVALVSLAAGAGALGCAAGAVAVGGSAAPAAVKK